ncbi:EFR1 family ferrodoxin [Methanogenium organophilum]|uniref:EFR1 family ferrodoxin n=1 Tax=Methanogenium organophilum TaxID=2199 RepID=A0A9X9S876_METOG|nr:EFR1 family ferrodoxin [Methanogenium organophilum]WAI02540.1 EFR1 family ferrodoxin [Methanogenium organophilum]
MKTILYYFTGTGNSLWAARELACHIPDTELIPMAKVIHSGGEITVQEGRIGFVFPVYIGGPPLMVSEFARKINLDSADGIFALVTMAGAGDGAWKRIKTILKKRSYQMGGAYSLKMPTNYMLLGDVLPEDQEIEVITEARTEIKRIAEQINAGDLGFEKGPFLTNLFNSAMYQPLKGQLRSQGSRFRADEKCNGCGTCELVCPAYNITVSGMEPPKWGNACESCFACINYCPRNAIQSGKKTVARGRYHHPDVSIRDLMVQNGRE